MTLAIFVTPLFRRDIGYSIVISRGQNTTLYRRTSDQSPNFPSMGTKTGVYTYQNTLSWKVDMTIRALSGYLITNILRITAPCFPRTPEQVTTDHPSTWHPPIGSHTVQEPETKESEERFPQGPKRKQLF
jgi:hypothetical protein